MYNNDFHNEESEKKRDQEVVRLLLSDYLTLYYKDKTYEGLVYMPDPETKEDHIQKPIILELIFPKNKGLEVWSYGRYSA